MAEITAEMDRLQTRHLPVVSEAILVGIVSAVDLASEGKVAADIMTRDVLTCAPDDPIEVAAARMATRRVRALPVVEAGELVGIVTSYDMLDALVSVINRYRADP